MPTATSRFSIALRSNRGCASATQWSRRNTTVCSHLHQHGNAALVIFRSSAGRSVLQPRRPNSCSSRKIIDGKTDDESSSSRAAQQLDLDALDGTRWVQPLEADLGAVP